MFVIGTAGHIDHGKTLLIKTLTGIDCDRLPEEKEREMTIELGFAHMDVPGHGTAGVIDVPGHERFIRNMVAGAWGMDIGLLVVAADDGWMPQTEDHFRVLRILNVPRIIGVINKIDLADRAGIDNLVATVAAIMERAGYKAADVVRVSAKTGDGIEQLKSVIAKNCGMLPPPADQDRPYLFVDRVFAVKGHGTVVTGTQKNGTFREGDQVTILPRERDVRLKRVESHNQPVTGESSIRAALNITGLSLDEMPRGGIVVKRNFFTRTDDFIAVVSGKDGSHEERKNIGIEVLAGTADVPGRLSGTIHEEGDREIVRIRLDRPWFLYPGQKFVITKTGGYRIFGGGVVLIPRYDRESMKAKVVESAPALKEFSPEGILSFIFAIHGWLSLNAVFGMVPFNEKTVDAMVKGLVEKGEVVAFDNIIIRKDHLAGSIHSLRESIKTNPGLHMKEIADRAGIDHELCAVLARRLVKEGGTVEKEGRYFPAVKQDEASLGEAAGRILKIVKEKGIEGAELNAGKGDEKKIMKELIGLGMLVSIDGNLLWHKSVYDDMKSRITRLLDQKDKISVGDARDATGLSRKYLIPLLNRLERDGVVKRAGDFRVKP